MRMRGWGVLLVLWLGALILVSQAFAASQTLRQREAAQRRSARSLIVAEAARLGGEGVAAADSTRRSVESEGDPLVLETVRGPADATGQAVRLRVLGASGVRLQEHGLWIEAPRASSRGGVEAGSGVTPERGARLAGGSTSSSPPVSHQRAADAVPSARGGFADRSGRSSN